MTVTNPSRIALAAALLGLVAACASNSNAGAGYGVPVPFAKNRDVVFAHFTMRYLGERKVSSPIFKPCFTFYDFEVRSAKSTQTVSWSSGTGVIDSASFKVDGRPYELELKGSVARKGWLREDEMVVWPEAEFLRALEARNRASR
jgi:hypothetical protein